MPMLHFRNHRIVDADAMQINEYRAMAVREFSKARNIMFRPWGGLGDRVCAEPTIRWAFKNIPFDRMAIATASPDLYSHIGCEMIKLNMDGKRGDWNPLLWYELETIVDQADAGNLSVHFIKHLLTHPVDYVSMHCFGKQLPVADREIRLPDFSHPEWDFFDYAVVVHPGKHWASKTFPAQWWESVCIAIQRTGLLPILIGARVDENVGYVEFKAPPGVLDFRDVLPLEHTIMLLKKARCLISNDSAPVHIAAAGDAHIGVIATCKHPDYLAHWRHGQWAWRFKDLARGGVYQDLYKVMTALHVEDGQQINSMDATPEQIASFLPEPSEVAAFAKRAVKHEHYPRLPRNEAASMASRAGAVGDHRSH